MARRVSPLERFHPAVREWFTAAFAAPTRAQALGWPPIGARASTLILAPTGSGKTLAAFLWAIDRLMFSPVPPVRERCRVLYLSPLKALAVDVDRNLRAPIAGIANLAARRGEAMALPAIAVRTGDTPAAERARFQREPADILITTPESLYLLLTSNAREVLRSIDTVIIDEIHALVPTKRGAHLALSLERLEAIVPRPLQRIGLSATQRPLEEVAQFLGGCTSRPQRPHGPAKSARRDRHTPAVHEEQIHDEFASGGGTGRFRPVTIVNTAEPKPLDLTIEVPVEDMARLSEPLDIPSGPAAQGPVRSTLWSAIHPRLLELIRQHQTTLIFVNSRRVAERLAGALNELAGETLVRSHHGSLARAQRIDVEDSLKAGRIRALVATSSLELGIDMGAIDLVVQIEAPPSVASGLQRIGRGGHHVGATSRGIIVPKYRGDLIACAAVTRAMRDGLVEATRYPRNPLDVLAQQIVAMAALDTWDGDELFDAVRRAAPFADLGRTAFDGVLDMLAGRYPSDEFAELRPRITWDRVRHTIVARDHARRVAVINGGTIPDRGLYGVFLSGPAKAGRHDGGSARGGARVGELDEEMVFECRVGEVFVLGASSWRIEEITHDRVLVSPAPGEPGKMPFWKGEAAGRPLELGRHIGRLVRELREMPAAAALDRLVRQHDLDRQAATNLLQYLHDQAAATEVVPDDRSILVERCRDELGDWRVCVLTPFGGRVHAPWSMAVVAKVREQTGVDVETMWTDDGFVVRFPETDEPPDARLVMPAAGELEALVLGQLGASALFAARFRENAARALLLPRRRPGGRAPLWQQRKRAADLLAVAARFGSFPILLETYRECLRDVFDIPALVGLLRQIEARQIRVTTVDSAAPSPFAAAVLFGYVANYIYEGDAPLAERRAHALSIDQAQLQELLGEVELRELLDETAIADVERELQHLEERLHARSADGLHDLLLRLGDLTADEMAARSAVANLPAALDVLVRARRVLRVPIAGASRVIAVEHASRYRDALGVPLPSGVPEALLEPTRDPRGDLLLRYARTHGPFTTDDLFGRYGMARATIDATLRRLTAEGKLVDGAFKPGGTHREWCAPDVLRTIRRRSLAKLRHQIEPVDAPVFGRFLTAWQGLARPHGGGRRLDALLDVIDLLQGAPLPASILEREILAARLADYQPGDLDALAAAGEVVWCGVEPLGERDGRVSLFLTDHLPRLWRPPGIAARGAPGSHLPHHELPDKERRIVDSLAQHGASFFAAIHAEAGGGYPGETVDALWNLAWSGRVTNDTFHALRAFTFPRARRGPKAGRAASFRSRRLAPASAEGRWSLVETRLVGRVSPTEWSAAVAQQLLSRYGIVSREIAGAEALPGGFSAVYDVLKVLEESGRVRRGYFVAGIGATQFALPAAIDLLRSHRDVLDEPEVVQMAATDPANPYGVTLAWPALPQTTLRGPTRSVGATVVLIDGELAAYLGRGGRFLFAYLPDDEASRARVGRALAQRLARIAAEGDSREGGLLIADVNGAAAGEHPIAAFLADAGFAATALGFQVRRNKTANA